MESAREGSEAGLNPVEETGLDVAAIEARRELVPCWDSRERRDGHEGPQLLEACHHLVYSRHPAKTLRRIESSQDPIFFELPLVRLGGEGVEGGERPCRLAPEEVQLGEPEPNGEDEISQLVTPRVRKRLRTSRTTIARTIR